MGKAVIGATITARNLSHKMTFNIFYLFMMRGFVFILARPPPKVKYYFLIPPPLPAVTGNEG